MNKQSKSFNRHDQPMKIEEKKGFTIFLIDDDLDFLEIHCSLLKNQGYDVHRFSDPQSAFKQMELTKPDLIITDLMLSDLDSGFNVIRDIRQNAKHRHIPLILVTAISSERGINFSPQSDEELEEIGVQAFFEKPVNREKLLEKITEILDLKASGGE